MTIRVAVVGGGIRGCSVAAMLAQTAGFAVSLIERGQIASGITHTNHGRLHGGTEGALSNHPNLHEMIARRKGGYYLGLMNAATNQVPGINPIETSADEALYLSNCQQAGIHVTPTQPDADLELWIDPAKYHAFYSVPEFGFDPAQTSRRLAEAYSQLSGLQPIQRAEVTTINVPDNDHCTVELRSGNVLGPFDVVITAVAGWENIRVHPSIASVPMNFEYPGNRLLYIDTSVVGLSKLERVISIMASSVPSAIPHGNTIVFGCDVGITGTPMSESDQGLEDHMDANQFQPGDDNFRQLAVLETHFPCLRLPNVRDALQSFRGPYPRISGQNRNFELKKGSDKFYACYGGNATTSLIDAYEAARVLCTNVGAAIDDEDTAIRKLIASVSSSPQFPLEVKKMAYYR